MSTQSPLAPILTALPRILRRKELEARLLTARREAVAALGRLVALKEDRRGPPVEGLAALAVAVGEQLGLAGDDLEDLRLALVPRDVGKLVVPDAILLKPGRLSDAERREVQKHPEYGWAILQEIPGFEEISRMVLCHHERLDGTGYPGGLRGEEIPVGARILSVVDAFEAMLSSRAYRGRLPLEEAIGRLRRWAGTRFDPEVAAAFADLAVRRPPEIVAAGAFFA